MEGLLTSLMDKRKDVLFYYCPYNFIRAINPEMQWEILIKEKILGYSFTENHFIYKVSKGKQEVIFFYEYLQWDSNFFGRTCYKLFTVLYADITYVDLVAAVTDFKNKIIDQNQIYLFIDTPAEDIFLIQSLTQSGFKLVETRLHFFKNNIQDYAAQRYLVKKAIKEDEAVVAEVSRVNRNNFDRLHADVNFPDEPADDYLAVYAGSALNGFCDTVLIPAESGLPLDSFLALSYLKEHSKRLNTPLARIVLTAVGPANKGWHQKLISESVYFAKEMGAAHVLMTTQATNRAVFRTCEKLNFKLGSTSHILSFSS